jgi:hypothetical protein
MSQIDDFERKYFKKMSLKTPVKMTSAMRMGQRAVISAFSL